VLDARDPEDGRAAVIEAIADVPLRVWVHNKADLLATRPAAEHHDVLQVSARTGGGIEALHMRLRELAQGNADAAGEGAFTARARHVDALAIAREHLAQARAELDREALDLAAESLRLAHDALGEITGRVHADDLLGHIFSSFCIGK
jgi:tRNA modification GTPase